MTPILARNRGLIANVMQLARSESLCNRFSKGVWHKTPTPAQTQAPETPFRLRNARFVRRTQKVEPALQNLLRACVNADAAADALVSHNNRMCHGNSFSSTSPGEMLPGHTPIKQCRHNTTTADDCNTNQENTRGAVTTALSQRRLTRASHQA